MEFIIVDAAPGDDRETIFIERSICYS